MSTHEKIREQIRYRDKYISEKARADRLQAEVKFLEGVLEENEVEFCSFCEKWFKLDHEKITACVICGMSVCRNCWTSKEVYPETRLEEAEWETRCPECV